MNNSSISSIGSAGSPASSILASMKKIKDEYVIGILFVIIVVVIISLLGFYYKLYTLETSTCKKFNKMYPSKNGHLTSISDNADHNHMLRDYYIKTASNCCSTGDLKSGVVSTCALRDVIKQGARCLDFEIYSVDEEPVVATSTVNNYFVKEVYNKVPFQDALGVIINYAFSSGSCPNHEDPIIIHLRFKSKNKKMYEKLGSIFAAQKDHLLGPKHYFENNYTNFGDTPLQELKNKIVLVVSNKDKSYMETESFAKYINITSGSIFMREMTTTEMRNVPSMAETIQYNKKNMSIVTSDRTELPTNPGGVASRKMGVQCIGMSYQNQDTSFLELDEFFNSNNSAFVLKPADLRYVQNYISAPKKQDPKLSFATKTSHAQGLSFQM